MLTTITFRNLTKQLHQSVSFQKKNIYREEKLSIRIKEILLIACPLPHPELNH